MTDLQFETDDAQEELQELGVQDNQLALLLAGYQETGDLEARQVRERLGDTFSITELRAWDDDEQVVKLALAHLALQIRILVIEEFITEEQGAEYLTFIMTDNGHSIRTRLLVIDKLRMAPMKILMQGYQVAMNYLLEGGYTWGLTRGDKFLYHLESARTERCIEGITRPAGLSKLPKELKLIINHSSLDENGVEEDPRRLALSISMPDLKMDDGSQMYLSRGIMSAVRKGIEDGSLRREVTRIHTALSPDETADSVIFYIDAATTVAPMIVNRQELAKACEKESNLAGAKKHWGYIRYLKGVGSHNFVVTFYPDSSHPEWVEHMRTFWRADITTTKATQEEFKLEWFSKAENRKKAFHSRKKSRIHIGKRADYLVAMARFLKKTIKAKKLACEIDEGPVELAEEIRAVLDNEVVTAE